MKANERPVRLHLGVFVFAFGLLSVVGLVLSPWRGPYERGTTALMVTALVMTLLLWKLRGSVAESRPLTPVGRATLPLFAIAGWLIVAAVIIAP